MATGNRTRQIVAISAIILCGALWLVTRGPTPVEVARAPAPQPEARAPAPGWEPRAQPGERGGLVEEPAVQRDAPAPDERAWSEPVDWTPEMQRRLEEEEVWTRDALDRSRERAERSAGFDQEPVPIPGETAGAEVLASASRRAEVCADVGASCRSGADCCDGLACAGGIAGFATRGTCEMPR